MDRNIWDLIILTLPYFWLILLGVFILIMNYNVRHTKKGYRYPVAAILAATIVLSIVLGFLFYAMGAGRAIDDILGERMPFYAKMVNPRIDFWSQPENGRLAGMVTEILDDGLILYDPDKQEWNVDSSEAEVMPMVRIVVGGPLRLTGVIVEDSNFKADKIFPAEGPGQRFLERRFDIPLRRQGEILIECKGDDGSCPMRELKMNMPGPGNGQEFRLWFDRELLQNRDMFGNIIELEPRFLEYLQRIRISSSTLDELQK
jgi:hypothetical protein